MTNEELLKLYLQIFDRCYYCKNKKYFDTYIDCDYDDVCNGNNKFQHFNLDRTALEEMLKKEWGLNNESNGNRSQA